MIPSDATHDSLLTFNSTLPLLGGIKLLAQPSILLGIEITPLIDVPC